MPRGEGVLRKTLKKEHVEQDTEQLRHVEKTTENKKNVSTRYDECGEKRRTTRPNADEDILRVVSEITATMKPLTKTTRN